MFAKTNAVAVVGLEGSIVQVEVDVSPGLPVFNVVGLPDKAVQESRERVRAAVRNSGCEFPLRPITASLAPADLHKEGPAYDLPITVGLLVSTEQVAADVADSVFLGELSLDGVLRHVDGILPMVALAVERGLRNVFVPRVDAREAALVLGAVVFPVETLTELIGHLNGARPIEPSPRDAALDRLTEDLPPFPAASRWTCSARTKLRVQEAVGSPSALALGIRAHLNMQVPDCSIVASVFQDQCGLGPSEGKERLEEWQTSSEGPIGSGLIEVEATRMDDQVWALLRIL